jgi:CCR4-NOT transcriptional complex subunit CAF120
MTHGRTLSMDGPAMLGPNNTSYQSVTSPNDGQQQPGNSPSGQSGAGPAIPGPSNPNATAFMPTSAAGSSTSTSAPILDKPLSHSPPPTSPNTLLAHPQNGPVMDPSPTMTTISSARLGTQSSINSMSQGVSSTSLATSASPESPKVQDSISFDTHSPPTNLSVSPLAAASAHPKPPSAPLGPGSAQPYPNFLLEEARSKTQDSTSTKSAADVTSLEPVSDIDQKPTLPNLPSGSKKPANLNLRSQPPKSNTARSSPTEEPNDFINEAGALYYMQQSDPVASGSGTHLQQSMQPHPDDDETSPDESDSQPNNKGSTSTKNADAKLPRRRSTAVTFNGTNAYAGIDTTATNVHSPPTVMASGTMPVDRLSPTRSGLGRKPSGARAQSATTRPYNGAESISSQTLTETDESMPSIRRRQASELAYDDATGEAYAALTYLDRTDADIVTESSTAPPLNPKIEPLNVQHAERASGSSSQQPGPATGDAVPYKSTFAPTNKAAERKLKAQAQQAAAHAATHRPGRANGKRKMKDPDAWESSEEEEEEEDEEEDDDDDDMDSDGQKPQARGLQSVPSSSNHAVRLQIQTMQTGPNDYNQDVPPTPSHLRPARNLPQIPPTRDQSTCHKHSVILTFPLMNSFIAGDFHQAQPMPRRQTTEQYNDQYRRTQYEDGTPIRTQAEFPQPGPSRQVWSQVLDPGRTPGRAPQPDQPSNNGRDTFVQLEPSETMTKAFTPQGLLSAGLQDKEDRSARRQEELARESGASLINVPNKPPPPQTGLLGAITAHERERKREGGVGAALTEREREKRLAEERQRRFDDHQRQQLDQMQQGGSMYGGQFGFNPMMMGINPMMGMNPMMTGNGMNPMMGGGMTPMMTGGGMAPFNPMMTGQMGYPGMMGGFNPQHMFAAQQAAQVYHQAMMAFSVAGSQVGGEGGNGGGAPSQVNPGMGGMNPGMGNVNAGMGAGMTPAMGVGMGGYDPRMSMMGMPMMGMGMGMGMGVASPQMTNQMPLGVQMTGMSAFDPKSSPGGANGSPAGEPGLLQPNQNAQFSSRTSSPAGRGSPLARGGPETADRGRPSRPASPK